MWAGIDALRRVFSGQRELTAALKEFPDGSRLEFGRGSFDDWCVFVTHPPGPRHAPRDVDYFAELKTLHGRFPQLHEHFIEVFQRTSRVVDAATLERITELAALYPSEVRVSVDVLLTTLHAAMIAEENRAHAPLGKRIKRLGVHQVLVEGMAVEEAANYSRGRPWRELAEECARRGF